MSLSRRQLLFRTAKAAPLVLASTLLLPKDPDFIDWLFNRKKLYKGYSGSELTGVPQHENIFHLYPPFASAGVYQNSYDAEGTYAIHEKFRLFAQGELPMKHTLHKGDTLTVTWSIKNE